MAILLNLVKSTLPHRSLHFLVYVQGTVLCRIIAHMPHMSSRVRLITRPWLHAIFVPSSAALYSCLAPAVFVMSVVRVFLGRPHDSLPSIFPSINTCDALCRIRYPRYRAYLVLNLVTIYLHVPTLLNTFSLVIFSVHGIFNTLRNSDFVIVRVFAPQNIVSAARHNIVLLSLWSSGLCLAR